MHLKSLFAFAAAALVVSTAPAVAQGFPDGPGKEILEKKCSTCHAPEQVTTFGRSAEEWQEVVANMIDLGAEVTEDEAKVLVEYLAKNWPVKKGPGEHDGPSAPPPSAPDAPSAPAPAPPAQQGAASLPAAVPAHAPSVKPAKGSSVTSKESGRFQPKLVQIKDVI